MADLPLEKNSFVADTREDLIVNAIEIFDTIKQSLLVLDKNLTVVIANASFYKNFQFTKKETEGVRIYDVGNGQWDSPRLRALLEKIIPEQKEVNDYEIVHTFAHVGERAMLLNAREIVRQDNRQKVILLAIEDITNKKQMEEQTRDAEVRINKILENLVGSSERYTGGTGPQRGDTSQ
jgi:PAS domain S-box-containing protein